MKRSFFLFELLLMIHFNSVGQDASISDVNRQRIQLTQQGMTILAAWGTANIIYSGIAMGGAKGSDKYFYQMNLLWGGINLGLAAVSYFSVRKNQPSTFSESLRKQLTTEKLFLLNAGLDVAYIVGGFYLKDKAGNTIKTADRNKGFGQSIILQGGALLLFDGIQYFLHQRNGKALYQMTNKIQVTATANGIGCTIKI